MRTVQRSLLAAALALMGAQAACDALVPGERGYPIVPNREREPIAEAAAPAPPPVVAGAGGAGPAVPQLAEGTAPAGVTQEMVESGAQAFGTVCAACHGSGGSGTGAGPALADADWINVDGSYEQIVAVINNGVPDPQQFPAPMPPRGGGNFDEQQVRSLAAYVFALSRQ